MDHQAAGSGPGPSDAVPDPAAETYFTSSTSPWDPVLQGTIAAGFFSAVPWLHDQLPPGMEWVLAMPVLLGFAAAWSGARASRRRRTRYVVSDEALIRHSPRGLTVLPWVDVVEVTAGVGGISFRGRDHRRIRIDAQLGDFAGVLDAASLHLRASAPRRRAREGGEARREERFPLPAWSVAFRLAVVLALLVAGWLLSALLFATGVVLLLLLAAAFLRRPLALEVTRTGVVIRRALSATVLPLAAIRSAGVLFDAAGPAAVLVIERVGGDPVVLDLRSRTLAAADAVVAAAEREERSQHAAAAASGHRPRPPASVGHGPGAVAPVARRAPVAAALAFAGAMMLVWGGAALHLPAHLGGGRAAAVMVALGSRLEMPGDRGGTPLYQAAKYGHEDVVRVLAGAGADLERPARRSSGFAPLHVAVQEERLETARALLDAGADPDVRNARGQTPLWHLSWHADRGRQLEVAELLVRRGADPDAADRRGHTPLYRAVRYGNVPLVRKLVELGADAEARLPSGSTPLKYAAGRGRPPVIRALAALGADVDAADTLGLSALHVSVDSGEVAVLRTLIEVGSDLERRDGKGYNALHRALIIGTTEAARVLVEAGASLDSLDPRGHPPLLVAARTGRRDAIRILVAAGADLGAVGAEDGTTALGLAVVNDDPDVVRELLAVGAPPNAGVGHGWTGLQVAARRNLPEVVRALLEGGADPDLETAAVPTPLVLAAAHADVEVVRSLLEHGARPDLRSRGYTPLDAARSKGRGEIAELLETRRPRRR